MAAFDHYMKSTGIFGEPTLEKFAADGLRFWNAVAPVHPTISDFAEKLLRLPTAVLKFDLCEINGSTLSPRTIEKWLNIYYALNMPINT